jgi:hypothetical protein
MRAMVLVRSMAAVAGAAMLVGACADRAGVVAPREASIGSQPSAALSIGVNTNETVTTTFLVVPGEPTTAVIGDHKIRIPANAVCDPALSTYGPTEWDKPCQPLLAPLTITAKTWRSTSGHPLVDFQPALRFRPTERGAVTLYLMDKVASADSSYQIYFCAKRTCEDESLTDPSVATQRDAANGFAYRQLKHFSGYVIASRAELSVVAEEIY